MNNESNIKMFVMAPNAYIKVSSCPCFKSCVRLTPYSDERETEGFK